MRLTVRGELIKAVTTRTALGYLVIGAALAVLNVVIVSQFSVLDTASDKRDALAGLPILLLLFGVVGAAGEYHHGTAASAALVAQVGRGRLLLARAGAYAATALGIAAVMVAVSMSLGLPLLTREPGPQLDVGDLALLAVGTLVAAGLSAVAGVGIGALVRNQVAGVVGVLISAFLGMELLAAVNEDAVGFTPFGAAAVLAGDPGGGTLSWGAAAIVMAAWSASLLVAAVFAERRRDLA